jgi:TRAP-type transport system periplasmic protein
VKRHSIPPASRRGGLQALSIMQEETMPLRTIAAFLLASAALEFAPVGCAAEYTMKIGLATINDSQHAWANWYKEALEKRTSGRIEVKVFPRNQLGTMASQIEGLKLGTIEAFISPADFYAGVDPRFGVFSIPVLFKDAKQAIKVLEDAALNKEILGLGADKGIQVVSIFPNAPAHYFGKQPIRSLADFKGKKLRINATEAERAKMRLFGATGIPMDLGEVVPGLQQGVIDGTMSGTSIFVAFKFIDLGKVITRVNDTMIVSVGTLSRPWLAKLAPDLRQAVIEVGTGLQKRGADYSLELDKESALKWTQAGGQFVDLSSGDAAQVKKLLAGVGEQITKDNPQVHSFYRTVAATSQKY